MSHSHRRTLLRTILPHITIYISVSLTTRLICGCHMSTRQAAGVTLGSRSNIRQRTEFAPKECIRPDATHTIQTRSCNVPLLRATNGEGSLQHSVQAVRRYTH